MTTAGSSTKSFPLAPQGVFRTIQGEGHLAGLPMVFVRLAGCDVGCEGCDTDYSIAERVSAEEIALRVSQNYYGATEWVWVTGGEPTLHPLDALTAAIRKRLPRARIALATAGERDFSRGVLTGGFDFTSVSPHRPERWRRRTGSQLNLVPGLGGVKLIDFLPLVEECQEGYSYKYVTPKEGDPSSLKECLDWVAAMPGWRLGIQAHKLWGLP